MAKIPLEWFDIIIPSRVVVSSVCRHDVIMVSRPSILFNFRKCFRVFSNSSRSFSSNNSKIAATVLSSRFLVYRFTLRSPESLISGARRKLSTMAPIVPPADGDPAKIIEKCIADNKVMMFSKSFCPFCNKVSYKSICKLI